MNNKKIKIKTEFLEEAQLIQNNLQDISREFKRTKDTKVLNKMYPPLVTLTKMVFMNSRAYNLRSIDYISHELAVDIIKKFIQKPEFEVFAWYKYIKLVILRMREDYITYNTHAVFDVDDKQIKGDYWEYTSDVEKPVEDNIKLTSIELERTLEEVVRDVLSNYSDLKRLKTGSSKYYLTLIKLLKAPSNTCSSRILRALIKKSLLNNK